MTQTKQITKTTRPADWLRALQVAAPAPALAHQLNIRLSAELDQTLQEIADARGISRGALARMLLQAAAGAWRRMTPAQRKRAGGE